MIQQVMTDNVFLKQFTHLKVESKVHFFLGYDFLKQLSKIYDQKMHYWKARGFTLDFSASSETGGVGLYSNSELISGDLIPLIMVSDVWCQNRTIWDTYIQTVSYRALFQNDQSAKIKKKIKK